MDTTDAKTHLMDSDIYLRESDINVREEIGKLKQKFATLMEDDLLFEEGRRDELWAKYQDCIDQTEKELNKIVSSL
ncbi:MAG TPA: hypothetical protein VGK10_02890 [Prolixibacteraceae bacterium]|jgi:uncharacterized protein YjbJ (UPF0337 family)